MTYLVSQMIKVNYEDNRENLVSNELKEIKKEQNIY